MVTIAPNDTIGIGPNDGAWQGLSCDVAASLLRTCGLPLAEDRTYTNVQILPTPSGENLYVRSSFYG